MHLKVKALAIAASVIFIAAFLMLHKKHTSLPLQTVAPLQTVTHDLALTAPIAVTPIEIKPMIVDTNPSHNQPVATVPVRDNQISMVVHQ
jgi:hypothetical protein